MAIILTKACVEKRASNEQIYLCYPESATQDSGGAYSHAIPPLIKVLETLDLSLGYKAPFAPGQIFLGKVGIHNPV